MGRTEQLGKEKERNTMAKIAKKKAKPARKAKMKRTATKRSGSRPPQVGEARCSSSGCSEGQGSPSGSLNVNVVSGMLGRIAALRLPAETFLGIAAARSAHEIRRSKRQTSHNSAEIEPARPQNIQASRRQKPFNRFILCIELRKTLKFVDLSPHTTSQNPRFRRRNIRLLSTKYGHLLIMRLFELIRTNEREEGSNMAKAMKKKVVAKKKTKKLVPRSVRRSALRSASLIERSAPAPLGTRAEQRTILR